MKVTMIQGMEGTSVSRPAGTVQDVSEAEAYRLIAAGFASALDEPSPKGRNRGAKANDGPGA